MTAELLEKKGTYDLAKDGDLRTWLLEHGVAQVVEWGKTKGIIIFLVSPRQSLVEIIVSL